MRRLFAFFEDSECYGDVTSVEMEARQVLHRELGQPPVTTAAYAEAVSAVLRGSSFLAVLTPLPEAVVQFLRSRRWA